MRCDAGSGIHTRGQGISNDFGCLPCCDLKKVVAEILDRCIRRRGVDTRGKTSGNIHLPTGSIERKGVREQRAEKS